MDWSKLGEVTDWSDLSKMMEGAAGSNPEPDSKPKQESDSKASNEKAKQNPQKGSQDSKREPGKDRGQKGFEDGAGSSEQQKDNLESFAIAGWTDMKQFDDDHDPDWFEEEENRLAKIYGGHFIKVKYTEQGRPGYFCELCLSEMNAKKSLESHCEGMKHLKKKALWEKNSKGGDDADSLHADGLQGGWSDQGPPRKFTAGDTRVYPRNYRGQGDGMFRDRSPLRRGRDRRSSPPRRGPDQYNGRRPRGRPGFGPRVDSNDRAGRFDGPRDDFRGSREDFQGLRDDIRGQQDDIRGPRDDIRGPRDDIRGPRDDIRGPRDDIRGPRDDIRGPRDDIRGLRDDDFQGPRDGFRGPRGDSRGPPDNYQGPPDNFRGPPVNFRGPDRIQGPVDNMRGPPVNMRGPPDQYEGPPIKSGPAPQDRWSAPQDRWGGRDERSPMPAPAPPPPKEKLGGGTTGMLLTKLASCYIKDEEDADLALNVVSSLASSLREYNTKKGEKKIAELLMEAVLKLNTLKALKVGLKLLDNKQTPGSAAAATAAAASASAPRYAGPTATLLNSPYSNPSSASVAQYSPYHHYPTSAMATPGYQVYPATPAPPMSHPGSGEPAAYGQPPTNGQPPAYGQPPTTPVFPPHAQSQMMYNR